MIQKQQRYLILMLFGVLFMSSCVKSKSDLPAMTREGRNKIGYEIGYNNFLGGAIPEANITYDNLGNIDIFFVFTRRAIGEGLKGDFVDYTLLLNLSLDSAIENYDISGGTFSRGKSGSVQVLNPEHPSVFDISYYSPEKRILSGVFELNFAVPDTSFNADDTTYSVDYMQADILKNGRFDITY